MNNKYDRLEKRFARELDTSSCQKLMDELKKINDLICNRHSIIIGETKASYTVSNFTVQYLVVNSTNEYFIHEQNWHKRANGLGVDVSLLGQSGFLAGLGDVVIIGMDKAGRTTPIIVKMESNGKLYRIAAIRLKDFKAN